MKRALFRVMVLSLLAFSKAWATPVIENEEVVQVLADYLETARSGPVEQLIPLSSRALLEQELRTIIVAGQDNVMLREAKLAFSNYRIFGGYCRAYIESINELDGGFRLRAIMWSAAGLAAAEAKAPRYDISLVHEYGALRVDKNFELIGRAAIPDRAPDVDVCHAPVDDNDPSRVRPGETIEQQRVRLGIPSLGKTCHMICVD